MSDYVEFRPNTQQFDFYIKRIFQTYLGNNFTKTRPQ
jgi:hypothetical protein